MIKCSKCGQQLADDTVFCNNCGSVVPTQPPRRTQKTQTQQEQPQTEHYPQQTEQEEYARQIRENVAAQMQAQTEAHQQQTIRSLAVPAFAGTEVPAFSDTEVPAFSDTAAVKKPLNKKFIIIGAAVAAAAVAVLVLIFLLLTNKSGDITKYLYIKDGEIYLSDNGAKGWEVTKEYKSDESFCSFSKDGSKLLYHDKGALYIRDTYEDGNAIRISENVYYGNFSEDGSVVTYTTNDSSAYLYNVYNVARDEKVKLASDVRYPYAISDDFRKLAYINIDNGLYVVTDSSDNKEKIDSDVDVGNVWISRSLDEFYYMKGASIYHKKTGGEKEKLISDAIGIAAVDFESGSFYYETNNGSKTELYYYSNGGAEKVSDSFAYIMEYSYNKNILVICEFDGSESRFMLVRNGIAEKLDTGDKTAMIELSDDGKTLWYASKENDDNTYTLYRMDISDGVTTGEKIDDDISIGTFKLTRDGKVVYAKNYNGTTYDLYADKKMIDSDISTADYVVYQDGTFYYMTDYDSDTGSAVLKCCGENGESKRIKRDVDSFFVASSGAVLILSDVSKGSAKGELYIYDGGEPIKVDDDVTSILSVDSRCDYIKFD